MSSSAPTELRKTPLHAVHLASGARMVEFAGWDMPVEYPGSPTSTWPCALAPACSMSATWARSSWPAPTRWSLVQWITTNDASRLAIGQAQYSALTTPAGTFVDDVLVYRLADDHYLLVVNAANIAKDWAWIKEQAAATGAATSPLVNASARYALIAVQGPEARSITAAADRRRSGGYQVPIGSPPAKSRRCARRFRARATRAKMASSCSCRQRRRERVLARACSTRARASTFARAALARATRCASKPACACPARDMDEHTTVLEAGLGWIVGLEKDRFLGDAPLRAQKAAGSTRSWSRSR